MAASVAQIESKMFMIRGQKVMLSQHLAELYEVEPRALNQAVKRNIERFPSDFMFQPSREEFANLKSQTVISSWGGIRTAPYAFTEQDVAMLSSVLHSEHAIQVNIEIMRAFVRWQQMLATNAELSKKLTALEKKYNIRFKAVFEAIHDLMSPPENKKKRPIGFASWEKKPAMQTMCGALRADTDDEKGIGRSAVAREGKACAGLAGKDSACAEEAADFGCVAGIGGEIAR